MGGGAWKPPSHVRNAAHAKGRSRLPHYALFRPGRAIRELGAPKACTCCCRLRHPGRLRQLRRHRAVRLTESSLEQAPLIGSSTGSVQCGSVFTFCSLPLRSPQFLLHNTPQPRWAASASRLSLRIPMIRRASCPPFGSGTCGCGREYNVLAATRFLVGDQPPAELSVLLASPFRKILTAEKLWYDHRLGLTFPLPVGKPLPDLHRSILPVPRGLLGRTAFAVWQANAPRIARKLFGSYGQWSSDLGTD